MSTSNYFAIQNGNTSGWGSSIASPPTEITFTGGTLSAGSASEFRVLVQTASSNSPGVTWTVQASDDPGGSSPYTCGVGSVVVSNDTTGPQISNISVTNISDFQAFITWITNEPSTSIIDYGTTTSYGQSVNSSDLVTNRTLKVGSLNSSTTYHYRVRSVDAFGNSSESGDNTFVTTAGIAPSTPDSVSSSSDSSSSDQNNSSNTLTSKPLPNKIIIPKPPDKIGPSIQIDTDFSKPFLTNPKISGKVQDPNGISRLEYTLDGGERWVSIGSIQSGLGILKSFEKTLNLTEDNNYQIILRATDTLNNVTQSESYQFVIDRLPPLIGPNIITIGPHIMRAQDSGEFIVAENLDQKITLSTIGGPISVDIYAKKIQGEQHSSIDSIQSDICRKNTLSQATGNATLPTTCQSSHSSKPDEQVFSMSKNDQSGLWTGAMSFSQAGEYSLRVVAQDGAGNLTGRRLNNIVVVKNGIVTDGISPLKDAQVSLYYFEAVSKKFVLWAADQYEQKNPQKINSDGKYAFLVPEGRYYFEVTRPGYKSVQSNIFIIDRMLPINTNFVLQKSFGFSIGSLRLELPDFSYTETRISINLPQDLEAKKSPWEGKLMPEINLPPEGQVLAKNTGADRPTIVSFLNSWVPQASDQVQVLDELKQNANFHTVAILMQEASSSASVFKASGGFNLPVLADKEGKLVEILGIHNSPTHFFISPKGVILRVKHGILTKDELDKTLVH